MADATEYPHSRQTTAPDEDQNFRSEKALNSNGTFQFALRLNAVTIDACFGICSGPAIEFAKQVWPVIEVSGMDGLFRREFGRKTPLYEGMLKLGERRHRILRRAA